MSASLPNPGAPGRVRPERSNDSFRAMVYFALSGGGEDEFLRFQRNVRVVRMFLRVVFFVGRLIVVEWLLNWAHDPAKLRALLKPPRR